MTELAPTAARSKGAALHAVLQQLASGVLPMFLLFLLLLVSLYLLGNTTEDLQALDRFYIALLLLNGVGLLFLSVLVIVNTLHLISQFRQRVAGSRLTVKLVVMLVVIALVPVGIVYFFSINFLRSGLDNWFNAEVEMSLDKATELSRHSLSLQLRTFQDATRNVADKISDVTPTEAVSIFSNSNDYGSLVQWTLLSSDGDVLASRTGELGDAALNRPSERLVAIAREQGEYTAIDSNDTGAFFARVLVPVLVSDLTIQNPVLQGLFPLSEDLGILVESIEESYQNYRKLVSLRDPLKFSYIATLSLVLLLSALMAMWFAFYSSRRLMLPVHHLIEGTRAIAKGDYSQRLPAAGRDELSFLLRSFNDMTTRISIARDIARVSQAQEKSQRAYLETVLARISTGVLTVGDNQLIRTLNESAGDILECDISALVDKDLAALGKQSELSRQFVEHISTYLDKGSHEWRDEFECFSHRGRKIIVCKYAHIVQQDNSNSGYVLVFEDITTMVSAQREAAWSEVARRLAHEIRNPLTPIQLSAERMQHKLLVPMRQVMGESEALILERSTTTIVKQVESMKSMVNAFADYATMPTAQFKPLAINAHIIEISELYRGMDSTLTINLNLNDSLPELMADPTRLRQLFHNLIKNAIEAKNQTSAAAITISTHLMSSQQGQYIKLTVSDQGPGFPSAMLDRLFEPYTTSKPRGSGLGLVIVKKIVEEHAGSISASNNPMGGARVNIHLPVVGAQSPLPPIKGH